MLNVFFNDDILTAEKNICSSLKIPSLVLMENAGANSAWYIKSNYQSLLKNEVIVISGKGNNAGDGFVISRHLVIENINVKVIMLFKERELKGDALINYNILANQKSELLQIIYCKDSKDIKKEINQHNKIIIDSIFGVGFKGIPDLRMRNIFEYINSLSEKIIIAVDVPSGFHTYNQNSVAMKADLTLSMGASKFQTLFYEGREKSGKIEVMDIGVSGNEFKKNNSKNIYLTEKRDAAEFLPERKKYSNKYSNGRVFILSGSEGLTGACYLCSQSAMQTGSGAVVTGVPKSINGIMEMKLTEVMTLALSETEYKTLSLKCYTEIKERLKWADVVLIGPGLSKNEETSELVRSIVKNNNLNFVLDADGISAFKNNLKLLKNRKIILTPHFGEFANLIGASTEDLKDNFYEAAVNFAKEYKIVLVLKNAPAIITDGESFYINSTGRENLATAGTGDVLSGIISSLFSQSKNILNSAIAGVYIHGKCGDNLYEQTGGGSTLASDLIAEIPKVKYELSNCEN